MRKVELAYIGEDGQFQSWDQTWSCALWPWPFYVCGLIEEELER